MERFVDRKVELSFLEERYSSNSPELIIIYGRRRIGKTTLIKKFLEGKKGVYFLCDKTSLKDNLRRLKDSLSSHPELSMLKKVEVKDWYSLFEILSRLVKDRFIIALDEFPYLIETDDSIISVFQRIWDEILSKTKIYLILSGSSVSIMEGDVLGYKSPLHGRRTGSLKIQELPLKYVKEFVPNYSFEDVIRTYSVFGGVPMYLDLLDPEKSLYENIMDLMLRKEGFLYEEAENILRQEFRETKSYKLILRAISEGHRRLGEIANATGLDKGAVSRYIDILEGLDLIGYEVPPLSSPKSKRRLYYIKDRYLSFWFRFVYPNKSLIEIGKGDVVLREISSRIDEHVSFVFAEIVRKALTVEHSLKNVGRQWWKDRKGVYEIDVLGESVDGYFIAGEVKWRDNIDPRRILEDLVEKVRRLGLKEVRLIVFAKSLSKKVKTYEGFKVHCYDLKDLENMAESNEI